MKPRVVGLEKRALDLLSSMRLAIALFIILAIGCSIGTVIEQGREPAAYVAEYGATTAGWLQALRLTDMYHSVWFLSLIGLLAANSLTCLVRRFPGFWKSLRKEKTQFSDTFVRQCQNHQEWATARSSDAVAERMVGELKKRRYRATRVEMKDGTCVFAQKGIMGRIGAHVSHVSFLVILVGAVIGSLFGMKDYGTILQGETVRIPEGNFALHLNRFWIDYYDNGMPKGYYSDLSVIDGGREVARKTIRVNDPLEYNGVWIYQASYGEAWNRIQKATVVVRDRKTQAVVGRAELDWGKETRLENLGLSLAVTEYVSDFAYDVDRREYYSKTDKPNNPALRLAVHRSDGSENSRWVFAKYPKSEVNAESPYTYEVTDVVPAQYSGLQVARDPGVPLVWLGCAMLAGGLFLSSFLFHRRLWIKIIPQSTGARVHIGGTTNKNQYGMNREIKSLIQGVRS